MGQQLAQLFKNFTPPITLKFRVDASLIGVYLQKYSLVVFI
jgi:hypothetical protein